MVGDGAEPHAQLGPLGLVPALEPVHHPRGAPRGGGHVELGVVDAGGDAVVHHHAVLVEHQAVAALARRELRPGIAIDAVEEFARIGAVDLDLAQRRGVHHRHALARGPAFACHRGVQVFAASREVPGAKPLADVLPLRAGGLVRGVQRRLAARVEQGIDGDAGQRAEAHRRVGRPVGGGAHLGRVHTERARGEKHAVDVGQLALVGAEAQRRVALDMLDRVVVLAHRQRDVGRSDVVLEIDEGLGAMPFAQTVGHAHQGQCGFAMWAWAVWCYGRYGFRRAGQQRRHGLDGLRQCVGQLEGPRDGPHAGQAGAALARQHEGLQLVAPPRPAAVMAVQVHGGGVAGAGQHEVGLDFERRAGIALQVAVGTGRQRHDARAAHGMAPAHGSHAMATQHAQARPCRRRAAAHIDQRDLGAGANEVRRAVVDAVVVARDQHALAGQHAVAVQVGQAGGQRHHARHVVVAEHERALDRAGSQHGLARADLVLALSWQLRAALGNRQMVLQQLHREQQALVVQAEAGATREPLHVGQRGERGDRSCQPLAGRQLLKLCGRIRQQPAAEFGLLVDEQGLQPGTPGQQRGDQAGCAATDDENIHVMVQVVVALGVGQRGRAAEAGEAADHRLVAQPPACRPLEGLAVEARRHEARGHAADDRLPVPRQRGPARGARGHQALVQLGLRGLDVGCAVGAGLELHQGVGLLGAEADDAARAAVLETARDAAHTVGQQRRSQRIAGMALVVPAVEAERDGARTVHAHMRAAYTRRRGCGLRHGVGITSARKAALPSASVQLPETS